MSAAPDPVAVLIASCPFPLAQPGTAALWLLVAIVAGVLTGRKMTPSTEMTSDEYRRRYRYAPATSIAAQLVCLLLCLAAIAVHVAGILDLCGDLRGRSLLLIAPWCATALLCGLPWMIRVARR
jgi:hypothetical protein